MSCDKTCCKQVAESDAMDIRVQISIIEVFVTKYFGEVLKGSQ
jgi:hypothetical protein